MINEEYKRWCLSVKDAELSAELESISQSDEAVEDSFYRELEFGTGGLRGVLGAGTNRMNIYTVARASIGLAEYVNSISDAGRVAIGYDTRINSELFAKTAARCFASLGIKVYLYSSPLPTPMLSFAVRKLRADAGVMITASHNPARYNGYKVYGGDGCQITDNAAKRIFEEISKSDYFAVDGFDSFDRLFERGKIEYIGESVFEDYINTVSDTSLLFGDGADRSVRIVYTPLNGTGYRPVLRILSKNGYENLTVVKEQALPDGNFPTCPYPNPEIADALTLAIEYARRTEADLIIATDPDCDRAGVVIRAESGYKILTGNEVGLLLLDYIASQRVRHAAMPNSPVAVKTVVTSDLAESIAKKYGIEIINVLTGFKYIGEKIGELEAKGEECRYLFGFEESCGYLGGSYVRDKDGVYAAYMIAEMTAFYKARGQKLYERLEAIYREHGYSQSLLVSYTFEGALGKAKIDGLMSAFKGGIKSFADYAVISSEDFSLGIKGLPKSNVLKFTLEDNSGVIVRPSGTEPKLKIYISATAESESQARDKALSIKDFCDKLVK